MKNISNQHKKQKKYLLLGVVAILFLVGGLVTFAATTNYWHFAELNSDGSNDTGPIINYDPPTEEELNSSQDGKKNSNNADSTQTREVSEIRQISVEVSYAEKIGTNLEIRAFTPDVIESDGICTATVTQGEQEVVKTSQGFVDATTTICEPINIPMSEFSTSGIWSVVVTYTSPNSTGISDKVELTL